MASTTTTTRYTGITGYAATAGERMTTKRAKGKERKKEKIWNKLMFD
jgi:hypothetical protein